MIGMLQLVYRLLPQRVRVSGGPEARLFAGMEEISGSHPGTPFNPMCNICRT